MNQADTSDWREATRREPCPVCGKPDWCSLTGPEGDPDAAVCMRTESDNARGNGGWLHRLKDHGLADRGRPASAQRRKPQASTSTDSPKSRAPAENVDATLYPTAEAAVAAYAARHGRPDRQWAYHDAAGEPALLVLRWNARGERKKSIRPVRRTAAGWTHQQPPAGRPLYRLPELLASTGTVYVVEGEPAADALVAAGLVATTSSGGSKAADKTDWSPLAGRDVVLLPDNDTAGAGYRDAVLGRLGRLARAPRVRVVDLPGLPAKGDAVDWLAAGHTAVELARLVAAAEPVALADDGRPLLYRPFPTALLPGAMRRFVDEAAAAFGCDPAMVALPALAAAAGAIGATRTLRLKRTWYEPAVLWCVVVAPSGAMKSQGRKLVLAPILRRQKQELARYNEALLAFGPLQAIYEKDLAQWKRSKSQEPPPEAPEKPELREVLISDTTVEAIAKALKANPRGLYLDRDELGAWFGSFDKYNRGGGDAQNWMNLHGAGFVKVNRSSATGPPLFVDRACVSLCGTIQPAILSRALTDEHRESGLAARLLIAAPPRRPKEWTDEEVDEAVEAAFAERMLALLDLGFGTDPDGEPAPVALRLQAAAQRRFVAFVNRHGREGLDRDGDELAAWSKLEGYAARLALVLTLFDDPAATTVPDEMLAAAIGLVEWFAHEAARFYRGARESAAERELRELADWIGRRPGGAITPSALVQGRRKVATVDEAEKLIARLIDGGYGGWRRTPTATKPRVEFVLGYEEPSTNSPEPRAPRESVDVDAPAPPETRAESGSDPAVDPADDAEGWEAA
ncbi:DUF3987 domain-containing protein [Botrimarina sp.]|uniref:DUF3987 domain-containing protein n=1 Tax=Botrimarina sp. TaxID=2795802 RepID=UPI0032EAB8C7